MLYKGLDCRRTEITEGPACHGYTVIDLDRVAQNVRSIKKYIGEDTVLMAVVKADGYGHGAVEIAKTVINSGVGYLGVAAVDEGIELRKVGISEPILVLGYTSHYEYQQAVEYDIELTIYDADSAEKLSETAQKNAKKAGIHIKIDTGMGRIGFLPSEQSLDDIAAINNMPGILIKGIYSHLAESDSLDKSFAEDQFNIFMDFIKEIEEKNIKIPIKHISNSAAIIDLRKFKMNMVRAGIIIYGLRPSDEVEFSNINVEPALEWKSLLSHVKTVKAGHNIGYGRAFRTDKETLVGTVPIGYADGYSRSLSNRGRVLVGGKYAPIIGRICMDQFMVDLSDVDNPHTGDEVVLIGKQGVNEITADEIAALRGTINYEVVCNIGKRVKRFFKKF